MSNEKRGLWLFRVYTVRDEILPSYIQTIINPYKDRYETIKTMESMRGLLSLKLTNVRWKSMVGSDVFPKWRSFRGYVNFKESAGLLHMARGSGCVVSGVLPLMPMQRIHHGSAPVDCSQGCPETVGFCWDAWWKKTFRTQKFLQKLVGDTSETCFCWWCPLANAFCERKKLS